MYNDANVIKIKHDVLYEVAKLAFAGELDEKRDQIAFDLIPGPKPQFRCCIYTALSPVMLLQVTVRTVSVKHVLTHVILELYQRARPSPK